MFITLNARRVHFPIKTRTVQLYTIPTTTTSRSTSNARIMASSLEWQVLTVLPQEIAGEILNLRTYCDGCAQCVLYLSSNVTLTMTISMITQRNMPQRTAHHLAEVSLRAIILCVLDCSASVFKYSHAQYILHGIISRPLDF